MSTVKPFAALAALSALVVVGVLLSRPRQAPSPVQPSGVSDVRGASAPAATAAEKKVLLRGLGMA